MSRRRRGKKMAMTQPSLRLGRGVRKMEKELSVQEIEQILGLDKLKPIQLTPSDEKDMNDEPDYFKDWYEDELREFFKKQ